MKDNPFQIFSPEDLSAEDTVSLFVDVFTDFPKIKDPGHVIMIGPRGCGKSMMFRYLMPDCQCLAHQCILSKLDFLGIYIPLKNTNFALAELKRLERHAADILNSHILTTHFAVKIFNAISDNTFYKVENEALEEVKRFYTDGFIDILARILGRQPDYSLDDINTVSDVFKKISIICQDMYQEGMSYTKKLAYRQDIIPYEGPLLDYLDFLYPLLIELKKLKCMPKGPIYLLIDDAHWLSKMQAKVLNTWISTRTSSRVSLKISTQENYETYYTITGSTIDTPHDYSEIDISTIYTGSRKGKYRDRVANIVKKRLKRFGIEDLSPVKFFPVDKEQEAEIKRRELEYKKKFERGEGKGYYPSDDAYRYARPDYIKSLAGTSKSSSTYSYAGFEQLVHLSSGIIRFFLEPAHRMFSETQSRDPKNKKIKFIPPGIQNESVREEAERFLFDDLEKIGKEEEEKEEKAPPKEDLDKLSNLINLLGGLFRHILLSDRSERRVFSIAFSDSPSPEVLRILDLGVLLGYFHKSTIGRKDSKSGGRTRLYVLSRRLAPIWNLDPTGFSGYQFVTNQFIEEGILNPYGILRKITRSGIDETTNPVQKSLFSETKS
ncbi:MAG: hypothetical protein JSV88_20775 [Candidatus Aminicenantes bacterium]|nr:MAG: hypothetical protein JSV88_20775 [Candidatus Aminicenantes bacterium]